MPWWISILLAAASVVTLGEVADIRVPRASGFEGLGRAILVQGIVLAARVGQIVLPVVFLFGAAASIGRRLKRGHLLASFASHSESLEVGPPALTWREFEVLVSEVYRRQGYSVSETARGQDGGVDLVLRREQQVYFVQCKHWTSRPVDVDVVRRLIGVIAQRNAEGGAVVTSGSFTRDAVDFAAKAGIKLIDGEALLRLGLAVAGVSAPPGRQEAGFLPGTLAGDQEAAFEPVSTLGDPGAAAAPACPTCGAPMELRTARLGGDEGARSWGCELPTCRGTRSS